MFTVNLYTCYMCNMLGMLEMLCNILLKNGNPFLEIIILEICFVLYFIYCFPLKIHKNI